MNRYSVTHDDITSYIWASNESEAQMLFINDADELGIILYAPVIANKVSF